MISSSRSLYSANSGKLVFLLSISSSDVEEDCDDDDDEEDGDEVDEDSWVGTASEWREGRPFQTGGKLKVLQPMGEKTGVPMKRGPLDTPPIGTEGSGDGRPIALLKQNYGLCTPGLSWRGAEPLTGADRLEEEEDMCVCAAYGPHED